MTHTFSARVFTWLAGVTALFQLALVAGAPWGAYTQGGRFTGALPAPARLLALASAALLLGFVALVRGRAHPTRPPRFRRAIWGVVVYCALGVVANAATPSAVERAMWLPVVAVMFLTSLHVARHKERPGAE